MIDDIVIVRGGGDLASGTIQKLYRCGFKILVLEVQHPTSIRRNVSFSECIYEEKSEIEGIVAVSTSSLDEIKKAWMDDKIPVTVDPKGDYIKKLKPNIVVDAIIAKKNMGTTKEMANITIALGPGFCAGKDVDIVIETARGHDLGRLILKGEAKKNTGVPGEIGGYSKERVIHSPCSGVVKNVEHIGSVVKKDHIIAYVGDEVVKASISGLLRGIIRNNSNVSKGMKIADIDPRISEKANCNTISDKARNIAGGVLEAIFYMKKLKNRSDKEDS